MSSEDVSEPTGWGISAGLFGSDASAEAGASDSRQRSAPKRKKSSRPSLSGVRKSGSGSRDGDTGWPRPKRNQGARGAEKAPGADEPRSEAEWESLARSVLLRQLALGPRSRHQLEKKLTERDVPSEVVRALLDRFEEVQLIDDAEFARMMVRTRTAARSLSRASLRRELAEKGIDAELAEDALLQITDEDEHEQARDVVRRKLRSSADLSEHTTREREMRRLVGVLARKGYTPGTAFSIVKQVMAEVGTEE